MTRDLVHPKRTQIVLPGEICTVLHYDNESNINENEKLAYGHSPNTSMIRRRRFDHEMQQYAKTEGEKETKRRIGSS